MNTYEKIMPQRFLLILRASLSPIGPKKEFFSQFDFV